MSSVSQPCLISSLTGILIVNCLYMNVTVTVTVTVTLLCCVTLQDLLMAAAGALAMLGGGQRDGRRNSSARSRPRSAARK